MDQSTPAWNPQAMLRLPAFAPLHPLLCSLEGNVFPSLQDFNRLLAERAEAICVNSGKPLCFVPQMRGRLPFALQYEPRCYLNGELATREQNWHDLFNALVWLTFPRSKAVLNASHYHALVQAASVATAGQRGAVRDSNTLLDESGVLVACADMTLAALLRGFEWKELFWQRRDQVQSAMGFYLFGHGLYEKALCPYVGMTGQGLILPVPAAFFAWSPERRCAHLDEALSTHLTETAQCRNPQQFTPVPLLGIPGWTPDNVRPEYYDDVRYFRPGRRSVA